MPKISKESAMSISTGTIVRAVLVLVGFYFFYYIKDVLLVILTAIVVASAVEPGTRWFMRRRIPRVPSVLLIYLATAAVLVGSIYFFIIPLVTDSYAFLNNLPSYSETLSQAGAHATSSSAFLGDLSNSFSLPALVDNLNTILTNISSGFLGTIDVAFGGAISFFLIVVLSFYLAMQEDGVGKFLRIIAPIQYEKYVVDLWRRSKEKIGLWMQGQILLALIVAVLVFLGLTLIGIREALVLSFLAGLFEIIPLFGAFLAAAPAVLVATLDGGLSVGLVVAGLFLIVQQFESQLIYPLVVKKVVGVPPIISILALVIGAKLAGFLGVILAVPLAAVAMELLNDYEKRKAREIVKA
jgi:predicted PurR-regulated permease PerM